MESTRRSKQDNEQMAKRLKECRERAGYDQQTVARTLGIKSAAVSNWETAANRPGLEYIPELCVMYNVNADELLDTKFKNMRMSYAERTLLSNYRMMSKHGRELVSEMAHRTLNHELAYKADLMPVEFTENLVPLFSFYSAASAGVGDYLPNESDYETVFVYPMKKTKEADMIITVNGDSMEPTYAHGDKLLIQKAESIDTGEIGVFIVNGDSFVKELGKGILKSHNKAYPNIKLHDSDSVSCVGRIVGLLEAGDMPKNVM